MPVVDRRPAEPTAAGVGFGIATVAARPGRPRRRSAWAAPSGLDATFVFSRADDAVQIPDLTVPARATGIVLGVVIIALGALLVAGVLRRRIYLVFGIGLALFVVALLAWAARGDTISIIGLLDGTLFRATPLALGRPGRPAVRARRRRQHRHRGHAAHRRVRRRP